MSVATSHFFDQSKPQSSGAKHPAEKWEVATDIFAEMRNQIILALNLALKKKKSSINLALDPGFGIKLKWNDEQRKKKAKDRAFCHPWQLSTST